MSLKPCRWLDYDEKKYGTQCTLRTCAPHFPEVRYWFREVVPYDDAPRKVQFCGQGRGRINSIFDCYDGSLPCYEPEEPTEGGQQ